VICTDPQLFPCEVNGFRVDMHCESVMDFGDGLRIHVCELMTMGMFVSGRSKSMMINMYVTELL